MVAVAKNSVSHGTATTSLDKSKTGRSRSAVDSRFSLLCFGTQTTTDCWLQTDVRQLKNPVGADTHLKTHLTIHTEPQALQHRNERHGKCPRKWRQSCCVCRNGTISVNDLFRALPGKKKDSVWAGRSRHGPLEVLLGFVIWHTCSQCVPSSADVTPARQLDGLKSCSPSWTDIWFMRSNSRRVLKLSPHRLAGIPGRETNPLRSPAEDLRKRPHRDSVGFVFKSTTKRSEQDRRDGVQLSRGGFEELLVNSVLSCGEETCRCSYVSIMCTAKCFSPSSYMHGTYRS